MSKRYSEDLSMSHLNLIGYWTGHPNIYKEDYHILVETGCSSIKRQSRGNKAGTSSLLPVMIDFLIGDAQQVFQRVTNRYNYSSVISRWGVS